MTEDEHLALSSLDQEVATGAVIQCMQCCRRAQHQHFRAGNSRQGVRIAHFNPRHTAAVIKAYGQVQLEPHTPFQSHHDAHHAAGGFRGHEVDQHGAPGVSLEQGFENQRTLAVAPFGVFDRIFRADFPASVARVAEQRGETGWRIESREAQPVQRTVLCDQRGSPAIAEQCIVFNQCGHSRYPKIQSGRM